MRPLRRAEYDKLVALGVFEGERLELLDGLLVPMSPIDPAHGSSVDSLAELLILALHGRARARVQNPFAALELSEPEPDVVVAPLADYRTEHPSEAYLIVEVAGSSLTRDRGHKRRLYAECRVQEYWIVNLVEKVLEVFRDPDQDGYRQVFTVQCGQTVGLLWFPDVEVRVDDVFK